MHKTIADSENSKVRYLTRRMAAVAVLALAATTMIGVTSASAAALANTTWSVSDNQAGATGVAYRFEFTTATAGTIGSVTATVPAGTAGTGDAGTVYGLGAGTASLDTATNTLTYTVTNPAAVAVGVTVYIEFTGLTNPTAGPYTSTVTTMNNAATPGQLDTAASSSVSIAETSTVVTVEISKSLTFTNDTPSFTLQMDPSSTALSDQTKAVTVTVKTNAGQGYTLAAKDTGLKTLAPIHTIPAASGGVAVGVATADFVANTFGVSAAVTPGGASSATVQGAGLAVANNFVGYTSLGETLVKATKPTGNTADILVLTNRLKIDYDTAAGTYTDSITYTATPTY